MAAPVSPQLPRLRHPDAVLQRWAEDLARAIENELARLATPAGQTGYTLTNVTGSRTLDPPSATTAQTAQVLATLLQDMQKKGQVA